MQQYQHKIAQMEFEKKANLIAFTVILAGIIYQLFTIKI